MIIKTFTYLIGFNGFIPQYCEIKAPVYIEAKIHPIHSSPVLRQDVMLSNRRKFYKIHKNKKTSNNYEGDGKNYQR